MRDGLQLSGKSFSFFANKLKRTVDKGIVNMHYLNLIGRRLSKNNHHGDSRAIFK